MVKDLDRKKLWKILHDAKNHYHTDYKDGTCSLDGDVYKLTGPEYTGAEMLEKEKLANEKAAIEYRKEQEEKQMTYNSRRHQSDSPDSEESDVPQTSDRVERETVNLSSPVPEEHKKLRFV